MRHGAARGDSPRAARIALLGFGAVGRALARQVVEGREALEARRGLRLDLVAICDSAGAAVGPGPDAVVEADRGPLDDDLIRDLVEHKAGGAALASHPCGAACDGAPSIVAGLPAGTIVVDCTATDLVTPGLLRHLDSGGAVVLANKLPLVGRLEDFDAFEAAAAAGRAAWEATVGAGVPIIATLRRMIDADDVVTRIEGTFSGTLNFVATELRRGRRLSDIVVEARARGFTEADPRVDLKGLDMARKALILARMLGWRLGMDAVGVMGLYPPELDELDVPGFMARLPDLDAAVADRAAAAAASGGVYRMVAAVTAGVCSVGPTEVPADSPLGRIEGTDNLVSIHSRWYDPTPLVLQGRGAGVDATASGVLADVVMLAAGAGAVPIR